MLSIDWNAVSAIASTVSAISTVAIAVIVQTFAKRSSTMQAMRGINSQWQDWNMAILSNPELAKFLDGNKKKRKQPSMSPDDERMFASIFYQLNILYDMMLAEEAGLCDTEFTKSLQSDVEKYLFLDRPLLDSILEGRWGYPDRFIDKMRAAMNQQAAT